MINKYLTFTCGRNGGSSQPFSSDIGAEVILVLKDSRIAAL